MNIYKMNNKEIRKHIREFGKSTYGKIVFLLSYMISFITFIASVELYFLSKSALSYDWAGLLVIAVFIFSLISFIKGSRYYYKEFKGFIENQDK